MTVALWAAQKAIEYHKCTVLPFTNIKETQGSWQLQLQAGNLHLVGPILMVTIVTFFIAMDYCQWTPGPQHYGLLCQIHCGRPYHMAIKKQMLNSLIIATETTFDATLVLLNIP